MRPYEYVHFCPACGSSDPATQTDNGLREMHPDFTMLCLAQTGPCGEPNADPADRTCGMQWVPAALPPEDGDEYDPDYDQEAREIYGDAY